jgi:NitT/TauT family transport system substrate-binding protein
MGLRHEQWDVHTLREGLMAKFRVAAALGALLIGCSPAAALEKITLIHSVPVLTSLFSFGSSIPIEMGFWKEEGLEVEALPAPGAAAAIQLVVGGRATAAIANPSSQMVAVQKGSQVKFYYSAQRGDIFGIGLPEGSGFNTLTDLKGKSIGVTSFASGGTIYAKGLLKEAGLTEKDYTLVEIGVGARAAAALKSNQVQALSMYDEAYAQLEQAGLKMSKIIRDPRAKNYISGSIVVQNEDYEKRQAMLIGLARGIAKGQIFQETNPEAAVRIHWKVYPHTAPRGGVTQEEVEKAVEVNKASTKLVSRNALGTNRFGDMPRERMEDFQRYLVATGLLPKEIGVDAYYTEDLISKINDFNVDKIVALAKGYVAK